MTLLSKGDRIIFFGDSITESGEDPGGYVTLVRQECEARGLGVEVLGAGVSGNKVPDLQARLDAQVLRLKPTQVVIYIGINDVWHWTAGEGGTTKERFAAGLTDLLNRIVQAGVKPILCTPSVIGEQPAFATAEDQLLDEYAAISRKVAQATGVPLLELRQAMVAYLQQINPTQAAKGILTTDGVHLNDQGNRWVADRMLEALGQGPAPWPGKPGTYHGWVRHDFEVDGCAAIVVEPKLALPGRPWVWRAEFFDAFPDTDLALLARGFHLGFITVGNTFGCPDALPHWDRFYAELTGKYALSRRPALEGLSRGGLYIYNWTARNPDQVSCLYGDAPVCDFKSWPGGKGQGQGSPDDWAKLQRDYHFKDEAEALAFPGNPIDQLKPIAEAQIPIIHVYGDADDIVPWEENSKILAERYRALGGTIELIGKPGVGHHPHGLADPTPVVEFIVKCSTGVAPPSQR